MKDLLQWIPNFFKGMLEVMDKAKTGAGGGKKGQFVYWGGLILFGILLLIFIVWAIKPAYDSLAGFLAYFNINIKQVSVSIPSTLFPNLLLSLLIGLIMMVFMVAFAGAIGSFLGMIINIIFPAFTTYRIDKLFDELTPIAERIKDLNPNDETKKILDEITKLHERWQKRYSNRITRFLTNKMNRDKFDKMKL